MLSLPPGVYGSARARKWLKRGEFARLFDVCVEELVREGYAPSTFERHISGITHFLYWFKGSGGTVARIDAGVVQHFIARHLPRCRCAKQCARNREVVYLALSFLLRILRKRGFEGDPPAVSGTVRAELAAFEHHLEEVCGHTPLTCRGYLWIVKRFLSQGFNTGKLRLSLFTPAAVRAFLTEMSSRRSTLRHVRVALRSYFRFKAVGGMQVESLLAALPKTAQWSLARLPKTLTSSEIVEFLKSFDRTTAGGQRDYAMARCLIDLGLRGGETARLQLDDIDWRAGTVRISGKGQRVQVLPLPQEVGVALADYLRTSRPKTSNRALFMQLEAPVAAVTTCTVGSAMRRAARRCGLQDKVKGTHVMRHSIAGQLLNRGATLKGIADVLRHKSFDTTRIYVKVDLPALRRVAMPWLGRAA
jgi:integrase/recombinase XerD